MSDEKQSKISQAVANALSATYDKVALDKDTILRSARQHYHFPLTTWEEYQHHASFGMMDEIADGYIKATKIKVSGAGAVCGLGGFAAAIPDVIQFLGFTLRMVTEIAAAYGFDPAPDYMEGRVKCIVLQAYLNGNLGHSAIDGVEKIGVSAATKFLKDVAMRKNFLVKIIVFIGKALGLRITRKILLMAVPILGSMAGSGMNWYLAHKIADSAKKEFRVFREELRSGKYAHDSDYNGMGNYK